ncbi:sterol desaturase family protein [Candidatus Poriferisocius sp.]|uniref:sterol desaturase family protein n=1 Tax=Candidatus Poriferisocius sp. TaxID=3101276 RepID=UPI003B5CC440
MMDTDGLSGSELVFFWRVEEWYQWFGLFMIIVVAAFVIWEFRARWRRGEPMKPYTLDSLSSGATFFMLGLVSVFTLLATVGRHIHDNWAIWKTGMNIWALIAVFVAADLVYFLIHWAFHRVNLLWATHSVHHSSPYFNTPMAFRFGPLDKVVNDIAHLPLALFFDWRLIIIAAVSNQGYQAFIHNPEIGKLGFLEKFMNTPSHHRVHHGSDRKYLDKNYGGILIIWDRIFGQFQEEHETPIYGITKPINSFNPFIVWFNGFTRLWTKTRTASGPREVLNCIVRPPGWQTHQEARTRAALEGAPVASG